MPRVIGTLRNYLHASHGLAATLAYADTLHNLAHYLAGNDPDAQDLVQETYARALRSIHQFTPGTNLKAWLCRILRNTFVSEYRRRRGSPVVGGLDTVDPVPDVADHEINALRTVMADELETALMSLGEDARTVILLDLEGLTEVEVAEMMACAVGTVKSRLSRARAALRRRIGETAL